MPASKLVTATMAELVSKETGLSTANVRMVLDAFDRVAERALLAGHEVEVGTMGYLSLREPVQAQSPRGGPVTRGKRVAFRERPANRLRWP